MQPLTASIIVLVVAVLIWRFHSRRPVEPVFEFVYVNQDGSVRELSPAEQPYLSEEISGGDSVRPYIKRSYKSRDGWGSLSGFIGRRKVPARIRISPVHPDFDAREKEPCFDMLDSHRAAGDVIETRADGSVACIPNPQVSIKERFKLIRGWHLAHQREREKLAMVHYPNDEAST
jgi:hypothetical protein